MKVTLHIPVEQYGYVEVEMEKDEVDSVERVVDFYKLHSNAFKPQAGLSAKDFDAWLDKYLAEGTGDAGKYAEMSPEQQNIIQCIKRSTKRIKSRNGDKE